MASSSEAAVRCARAIGPRRFCALAVATALAVAALVGPAGAKVFHTQNEAIALAFPGADRFEKQTFILSPEQAIEIETLARSKLETKLVTIHTGWKGDTLQGFAFIDVHTVRTKPEGLMVVLDAVGVVRSVRVLAFHEPLDYLPGGRWAEQFTGKTLDDGLREGRDIHGIVGATLSARAATKSVRRALAYHQVLIRPAR